MIVQKVALAVLIASAATSLAQKQALSDQIVGARTWTHSDGRKIKAGIETATAAKVLLRLSNGKTGAVEISKLSDSDRDYIATWLKNNAAPSGFGTPEQTVEITTLKGQMKYNKPTFTVYPGKKVKLVLRNQDDMHHNLVICKPAKDKGLSVAMEAWKLGVDGFAQHWIPKHQAILFASKMADPQSTATIYFTAPKKTGKYPYVCTLPGHAQVMNGTMIVSKEVNPLSELTFTLYKGGWSSIPDWDTLEPAGTDHVQSGKFDLACTKERDSFGIVFNAKLEAPVTGEYGFTIGSDDGSRLLVDGKVVIDHNGIHGMTNKSGKAKLLAGTHDIEVQYFEKAGEEALYVGWKPPGAKKEIALSKGARGGGGSGPTGKPLIAETEARIYRNFIDGAGPRAIGVGYPGGLNLAFDANNMRIALFWLGDYIDAARHWNGRGQGFQPPSGESVAKGAPGVPFAVIDSASSAWPDTFLRKDNAEQPKAEGGYVFKGYRLTGEARIPTFRYTFGEMAIEDTPAPRGTSESADAAFVRTLKITGKPSAKLYFRAAVADDIEANADGSFNVGEDLMMSFKAAGEPVVRDSGGNKELLIPVRGDTIEQTIRWQ